MGIIGQAFTPSQPTIGEIGPTWASDNNAVTTELIARVVSTIDSASILLTTADVKHGTRTRQLGPAFGKASSGATWTPASAGNSAYHLATGAADIV